MASATLFALFKPNALETEGFAYCKTTSGEQQGVYAVDRVPSGRWQKAGAVSTRRDVREIEQREVTEEEALSGIGTYVGSAVCIARVPRGKPKVWDYGVVVGYTWSNLTKTGVLQVTFPDETCSIVFDKEEMQDPAIETYALRPCYMRGTADIMPAEMRALHIAAHDHFNGVGQPARRSSATVLKKISMGLVDEDQAVPVFNLECTQVEFLKIEHILNVIFYQVGKRRAPQGITVAKSLFEPVAEATPVGGPRLLNPRATDAERMAQLEDSDDDLAPVETQQDAPLVAERTKRVREEPAAETPADRGEMRLSALRRRLEDDPDMIHEIDQLIAFRQANLSMGSSALVRAAATETKSQFRPSRQQGAVHAAMVNVARGFFAWDFGFRGLSVRHFAPIDVEVERDQLRRFDMTDFSLKNKIPEPPATTDLAEVLAALEVLSLLVSEVYTTAVAELVDAARRFLLVLRKTKTMQGPEAVPELVAWVDDRFETFRSCLARDDVRAAERVKTHFQFNHESYARVVQRVTSLKVEVVLRTSTTKQAGARQKKHKPKGSNSSGSGGGRVISVPQEVVAALPIRKGKKLCMKFLSVAGCPGEGDTCIFDYRGPSCQQNYLAS